MTTPKPYARIPQSKRCVEEAPGQPLLPQSSGGKHAPPSIGGRQSLPKQRAMPTDSKHNSPNRPTRCSSENMAMCSGRNSLKEEQNITHPNSSSRSSMSIAVTLASSIARCTDTKAWEARNHCCVGGEKAREHAWRQRRMDECRGASDTYPACAAPILDPTLGPGKHPTRVGRFLSVPARTHSRPNTTWCGHALINVNCTIF